MTDKTKKKKKAKTDKKAEASFSQNIMGDISAEQARRGIMGKYSPRALLTDAVTGAVNLFRGESGQRGARHSKKIAPIAVDRNRADKRLKQLKSKPKKPYANAPRKPKANLD
tara:strand:+ start:402 stop:737 length:336 start_codon:yes stop_codon:yes gene_type:complete